MLFRLQVLTHKISHVYKVHGFLYLLALIKSKTFNTFKHALSDRTSLKHLETNSGSLTSLPFSSELQTVLLVCHDASRTGAPVLVLNIAHSLKGKFNTVTLLLGEGPLVKSFQEVSNYVICSSGPRANPRLMSFVIKDLCKRFNFKFAIVNSIESHGCLPELCNHRVPIISLIHEFASYTRPRDAFRNCFRWSNHVVFSASITLENAYDEYPELRKSHAHIIPQGRCEILEKNQNLDEQELEKNKLRKLLRPSGQPKDTILILGAGSVQYRKGIDLFIEAATYIKRHAKSNFRFVWIGKGFNPESDLFYSTYLADQLKRAELHHHFSFIDETDSIETAYEEADLFLLSSRLDPLPNVAIDAMTSGLPIVCFDRTTGIADFLKDIGLEDSCVADYLDTASLSNKLLRLMEDLSYRKEVSERLRTGALKKFNFSSYVDTLIDLGLDAGSMNQQEKVDEETIKNSALFRTDFCSPFNEPVMQHRNYVRNWSAKIGRKKPVPGFHPAIYLEKHTLSKNTDPFADYLRNDRPVGPWNYPVITSNDPIETLPSQKDVALHIHAYYPDMIPDIIQRISGNKTRPDLFISVTSDKNRNLVLESLKAYEGQVVEVSVLPNKGRDIAPFLVAFGKRMIGSYKYVGHLHTKKSLSNDSIMGRSWNIFLMENLLGTGSNQMLDRILSQLESKEDYGMIFPDDPNICGWEANKSIGESILRQVGVKEVPENFIFPIGSMFWTKSFVLAPLLQLNLDWKDFQDEPLPSDGTLAHTLERVFGFLPSIHGLKCATTNTKGTTR